MSSPAGLQHSQTNFIARWMPSSSRAGVILNPSPDLAESLRHTSTRGSPSRDPDDSFTSDFAPLPASTDSSCLSVHALARLECGTELGNLNQRPGGKGAVMSHKPFAGLHYTPQDTVGEVDSFEELVNQSQDLSLIMKLEQLRQWQQHMQEQLKARQLEELLRLEEEQRRMLGMMNGSDHTGADCTERSGLSGTDWEESTLGADSPCREAPYGATLTGHPVPQSVPRGPCQEPVSPLTWRHGQPQRGLDHKEEQDKETGAWSSDKENDQEELIDSVRNDHDATLVPQDGAAMTEDHCRGDERDRPIRPGIGGQKQTFEELLEEQLRLEEQKLKTTQQQQQNQDETEGVRTRRAFLKRGEGLSRFTNSHKASLPNREVKKDPKPQPLARVDSRRSSEPKSTLKSNISSSRRPPVQRKTAVLNKENRPKDHRSPPSDIRAESRTVGPKALGSHRRRSMGGTDCVQTDLQVRQHQQRQPGPAAKDSSCRKPVGKSETRRGPPNAVTKQVVVAEGSAAQNGVRAKEDARGSRQESVQGKGGEVPEFSFELSFQEKMRRWACDRQKESVELGEFELLEEAAEELSFSSNSSFIMKVLQMDEHHRQLQTAQGLHSRRLSSTPIKSPGSSPPQAFQRGGTSVGRSGSCDGMVSKGRSSDSEAVARKTGDDGLVNKVSDGDDEEEEGESKNEASDVSFCSSSEFGDREAAINPPTFPSIHCFSTSNPPYNKRSYQDQDREALSDLTEGEDGESDSVLTNPEDSTLTEDKNDQRGRLVFDDDDTWNDIEEAVGGLPNSSARASPVCVAAVNNSSPPERALKRKVAAGRGVAPDRGGVVSSANQELDPSPPATSQLMARLFPSLKPKAQTAPPPASAPTTLDPKKDEEAPGQQVSSGQQVQSRQLRERLVELELEIERFKKENTALTKLRQENEKNQENLRKERVEFEQRKVEELARFEDYKKEETRKLQKERKVFERHASAARAIPDKREREEIQSLKQQLSSLQEELRRRESRWSTTHSRLRQQIDSLNADNSSLKDEVRTLEKLRLTAWRRSQSEGEKDKREGLRMFESSGASSAKGVKFASPLDTRGSSPPQSSCTAPTKGSPRESIVAATAGIKSSLRKSSNAGPSPSAVPGRTKEERAQSVTRTSLDKPLNQDDSHNVSPNRECLQTEAESTEVKEPESNQEIITHPDGKIEQVLPCGGRLIIFPNGTRKELSADGLTAKVTFFNGDTKQVMADQRVIYYYADAQTTHTTYPDGMEVLQFPSNQTEKHFPDGRKEITFPDQTIKSLYPDGREESVLTDGTIIQVNPDGSKEIQFNTGQKEVHTAEYKRREYPDGTVKTVYTDGRQETHYPTGRIRVKDQDGNVVMDNKV